MGIPISQLPGASSLGSSDSFPVVQGGVTKRATIAEIIALVPSATSISFSSSGDAVSVPDTRFVSITPGNGLHLSTPGGDTATLTLADASATQPGQVNTGSQTFGGVKSIVDPATPTYGVSMVGGPPGAAGAIYEDLSGVSPDTSAVLFGSTSLALEVFDGTDAHTLTLTHGTGFTRVGVTGTAVHDYRFGTKYGDGSTGLGGGGDSFSGGICVSLGAPITATSITFTAPADTVTVSDTRFVLIAPGNGMHLSTPGGDTATLTLSDATDTAPGIVSIGSQTFGGMKEIADPSRPQGRITLNPSVLSSGYIALRDDINTLGDDAYLRCAGDSLLLQKVNGGIIQTLEITSGGGYMTLALSTGGSDSCRYSTPLGNGVFGVGGGGDTFAGGVCIALGTAPPAVITIGDHIYGSTAYGTVVADGLGDLDQTGPGTAGEVLTSNGPAALPTYQALPAVVITIGDHIYGSTAYGTVVADGLGDLDQTGPGTAGQVLTSNGPAALPTYQALTPPPPPPLAILDSVGGSTPYYILSVDGSSQLSQISPTGNVGYVLTSTGLGTAATFQAPTSGGVTSVINLDGSIAVSAPTGTVTVSINPAHSNVWTASQSFIISPFTVSICAPGTAAIGAGDGNSVVDICTVSEGISATRGGRGFFLTTAAAAGVASDGALIVYFVDGAYAVNVIGGSVNTLGTSGNTYRWNSSSTAPATQNIPAWPENCFGQGVIGSVLGTPDGWILVNVGGTDVKIPVYLP